MIGGNKTMQLQTRSVELNPVGEQVVSWANAQAITGWLDLQAGGTAYSNYNAKLQESTHVFVADYVPLAEGVTAENCRAIINGVKFDVTLIDNPMELNKQLEFYLKHVGG